MAVPSFLTLCSPLVFLAPAWMPCSLTCPPSLLLAPSQPPSHDTPRFSEFIQARLLDGRLPHLPPELTALMSSRPVLPARPTGVSDSSCGRFEALPFYPNLFSSAALCPREWHLQPPSGPGQKPDIVLHLLPVRLPKPRALQSPSPGHSTSFCKPLSS